MYVTVCVCVSSGRFSEETGIVLQCLDVMLSKRRKQVTLLRAQAFLKRLTTLGLHVLTDAAIGILSANRTIMHVRTAKTHSHTKRAHTHTHTLRTVAHTHVT